MQEQCRLISLAEYQKLLSDSMAKDEGVEINAELVHKIHILEKKLEIVTRALDKIYEVRHIKCVADSIEMFYNNSKYQIEELSKEN